MKGTVLHLTATSTGGGGKITWDIHRYFINHGYESYIVCRGRLCVNSDGTEKTILPTHSFRWNKFRRFLFRQIIRGSKIDQSYSMFNLCERFTCYSARDILSALPHKPDYIFIHWVSDFVNAKIIRDLHNLTGARIVFLLIDHALYSGGCHYQLDCQQFIRGCHNCPATSSVLVRKGIEKNYMFKMRYLPHDIIINANRFEQQRLRKSPIYRNAKIVSTVFPLDEQVFHPSDDKEALRVKWSLPVEKRIILVGSTFVSEKRKGLYLFLEAIKKVKSKNYLVVVAGHRAFPINDDRIRLLGYLDEAQLIEAYQFSDFFVCPSIADAGPLMVKQSCMCGTPVVAFPIGVSADLIETGKTGYLVKYKDVDDMAYGIDELLSLSKEDLERMSCESRDRAIRLFSNQTIMPKIESIVEQSL